MEEKKKVKNKASLKFLWPYIAPDKKLLFGWLISLIVTTVCMISFPMHVRRIFNDAITNKSIDQLSDAMLMMALVVAVLIVGVFVRTICIRFLGTFMVARLRGYVFSHVMKMDMAYFESQRAGDIVSRVLSDITILRETVTTALPVLVRSIFLFTGTVTGLLYVNAKLTAILFVVGPIMVFVGVVLAKKWRKLSHAIQEKHADMASHMEENINAFPTVSAFYQQDKETKIQLDLLQKSQDIAKKLHISSGAFFSFNLMMGFGGLMFVLWLGGNDVISGHFKVGDMIAYMLLLAFLGDAVSNFTGFGPALQNAAAATDRVIELLDVKPEIKEAYPVKELPKTKNGRRIKFDNVSFAYPVTANKDTIKKLKLDIKKGETVAIVGPSGAGKSTLFSLLMRFYEPQKGTIQLEGLFIDELALKELRSTISLVAQDPDMFSSTVFENIRYGKPTATLEEVEKAAKAAHAHEFIDKLDDGYFTPVGEKGVRLSGGQKQRIAIARTILMNPDVLLLDEATSSLDAESERHVQQAFKEIMQGRTTLVIAHRLATVKSADRIVVLDEGKIIDSGTHDELMKSCELYNHLASLQFLN